MHRRNPAPRPIPYNSKPPTVLELIATRNNSFHHTLWALGSVLADLLAEIELRGGRDLASSAHALIALRDYLDGKIGKKTLQKQATKIGDRGTRAKDTSQRRAVVFLRKATEDALLLALDERLVEGSYRFLTARVETALRHASQAWQALDKVQTAADVHVERLFVKVIRALYTADQEPKEPAIDYPDEEFF